MLQLQAEKSISLTFAPWQHNQCCEQRPVTRVVEGWHKDSCNPGGAGGAGGAAGARMWFGFVQKEAKAAKIKLRVRGKIFQSKHTMFCKTACATFTFLCVREKSCNPEHPMKDGASIGTNPNVEQSLAHAHVARCRKGEGETASGSRGGESEVEERAWEGKQRAGG